MNARLVAATNRNLRTEVDEGRFRKDLFYRLDVFTIHVPLLRDRIEDIPLIVNEILREILPGMGLLQAPTIHDSAMQALSEYHWPGNIRELKNILERALILSHGKEIKRQHVETWHRADEKPDVRGMKIAIEPSEGVFLEQAVNRMKRYLIVEAMQKSGNNVKEAAANLGISRTTLYKHLDQFDIEK